MAKNVNKAPFVMAGHIGFRLESLPDVAPVSSRHKVSVTALIVTKVPHFQICYNQSKFKKCYHNPIF